MNRSLPKNKLGFLRATIAGAGLVFLCTASASAQGRPIPVKVKMVPSKEKTIVPLGFAPPTGMCRIWIDGVPADQQPAPTDCATAVKNRPLNGKVIFSDEKATPPKTSKKKKSDDPSL